MPKCPPMGASRFDVEEVMMQKITAQQRTKAPRKYRRYEAGKQRIATAGLDPKDYERRVKALARKLKI